jgi:hypothetical protein
MMKWRNLFLDPAAAGGIGTHTTTYILVLTALTLLMMLLVLLLQQSRLQRLLIYVLCWYSIWFREAELGCWYLFELE